MSQQPKNCPVILVILDGVANNPNERGNAVAQANTPTLDKLRDTAPYTELTTYGLRVGLPEGQMGNSEVGHLNIGGGRVVKQELTMINEAVDAGELARNKTLQTALDDLKQTPSAALHLIGLVSRGGVHSSIDHLLGLLRSCCESSVPTIFLHAITDGRDRPPQAAAKELLAVERAVEQLNATFADTTIQIASVVGRYFAMDRDNRWERTQRGYDLFTNNVGDSFPSIQQALEARYAAGQTDEFLEPITLPCDGARSSAISDNDTIAFFNFRADRMRQIVSTFLPGFSSFEQTVSPKVTSLLTLTEYDETLPVGVLFPPQDIRNHLGDVIGQAGLRQLRIAETEKYPHVTYFFNGGKETPAPGEQRTMVPSPRDVATYDLKPEMSAHEVTEKILEALRSQQFDVLIINYANCDMVGHTGSLDAAVRAVETVDSCLAKVLEELDAQAGCGIVTADHGNADQMVDYDTGQPHTFHTTYPVPFFLVGKSLNALKLRADGALCDVAPTMCEIIGLTQPSEMSGRSLIES